MAQEWTAERLRKEVAIKCKDLQQQKQVIDKVESMGFRLWNSITHKPNGLYILTCSDNEYFCGDTSLRNDTLIPASEFLNTTPTNPELLALKKRLMYIADSGNTDDTKEFDYFETLHTFMKTTGPTCTALANLIINSDI